MVQQLEVSLSVPVPEDMVLISKVELERLKEEEVTGTYWSMKDLEKRTRRKADWLKGNILFQPRFRKKLDVENGGFVYYPKVSGQPWAFQAKQMSEFLDRYFKEIFEG